MSNAGIQFSIRSLIGATTAVAIWYGVWVAEPSWYLACICILLCFAAPVLSAVGMALSKGYAKTFFFGICLTSAVNVIFVPLTIAAHAMQGLPPHPGTVSMSLYAFAPVLGATLAMIHRYHEQSRGAAKRPSVPMLVAFFTIVIIVTLACAALLDYVMSPA